MSGSLSFGLLRLMRRKRNAVSRDVFSILLVVASIKEKVFVKAAYGTLYVISDKDGLKRIAPYGSFCFHRFPISICFI